jgi:homocysteine S-methyltransferase
VVSAFVPGEAVLVADGGLATELEARGNDLSDALWSARLLMDAPEEILGAHLAFFRAGAVIATSASYQASFDGFARRGLGRGEAAGLMRRSVDLARAARDQVAADGRTRWVAASAGPAVRPQRAGAGGLAPAAARGAGRGGPGRAGAGDGTRYRRG